MPREHPLQHRAPLTNHHADGTLCPPEHKHTSSGKPLHPGCPGCDYSKAVCTCGNWEMKDRGKGYVNESRRRHLATHPQPAQPPKVLRDLLRLDTP
jgi:hypothetical protein